MLGHDPQQRSHELRERMGIVLQSTGMYRHIAVREAIAHWARFYPCPRDVDEVVDLAGLRREGGRATRGRCSGGQLRRLDFALALVGDPELIFLDEPTTGFDPAARRAAWDVIRSLQDLGKTVLLTTHYLDEAQALCDRVAIVKEGRFVAEGPPASLGAGVDALPRDVARRRRRARRRARPTTRPPCCTSSRAPRSRAATGCATSPSPARRSRTSTSS